MKSFKRATPEPGHTYVNTFLLARLGTYQGFHQKQSPEGNGERVHPLNVNSSFSGRHNDVLLPQAT